MRSLITGVGGFAGQHLAAWLLRRGEAAWGVARGDVRWHVDDVAEVDRFHLLTADLTRQEDAAGVVKSSAPDRIYHLAAKSSVGESFVDPLGVLHNNVACLVNILEAVRSVAPSARVLVVSAES